MDAIFKKLFSPITLSQAVKNSRQNWIYNMVTTTTAMTKSRLKEKDEKNILKC